MKGWLGILLIALTPACNDPSADGSESDARRQYTISDEPDQIVLEVESRGGLSGMGLTYALFGDGRLEMRLVYHDGQLKDGRELYLARDEVENLVGNLVENGVVDCDTECLGRKYRATIGTVPLIIDFPTITATVRLEQYALPGRTAHGPFQNSLSYQEPQVILSRPVRASIIPFKELEALFDLHQSLARYWSLAGPDQ